MNATFTKERQEGVGSGPRAVSICLMLKHVRYDRAWHLACEQFLTGCVWAVSVSMSRMETSSNWQARSVQPVTLLGSEMPHETGRCVASWNTGHDDSTPLAHFSFFFSARARRSGLTPQAACGGWTKTCVSWYVSVPLRLPRHVKQTHADSCGRHMVNATHTKSSFCEVTLICVVHFDELPHHVQRSSNSDLPDCNMDREPWVGDWGRHEMGRAPQARDSETLDAGSGKGIGSEGPRTSAAEDSRRTEGNWVMCEIVQSRILAATICVLNKIVRSSARVTQNLSSQTQANQTCEQGE